MGSGQAIRVPDEKQLAYNMSPEFIVHDLDYAYDGNAEGTKLYNIAGGYRDRSWTTRIGGP